VIAVLITTIFLAAVYSLVALGLSLTWAGLRSANSMTSDDRFTMT